MTGDGPGPTGGYVLAVDAGAAGPDGDRAALLAALFDPVTLAHVDALGPSAGWRCWEVGAGGPSVPLALADRVAPGGSVVATDLDVSRLPADLGPAIEVRRHDVAAEPPPGGPFDLVHARLVLTHVPERDRVLDGLAAVLAPGGWLLVEDADPSLQPLAALEERGDDDALVNRLRVATRSLLADGGADLAFGRTLPRRLTALGLRDVAADAWFPVTSPVAAALERATLGLVGDRLVAAGRATRDELDRARAALADGRVQAATSPLVSAWGRRPGPAAGGRRPPDGR